MAEALPNPLIGLHREAEAELQPYGDLLDIVSTFGEPEAEYAAMGRSRYSRSNK